MVYVEWVRNAKIEILLNELIELHEDYQSAREDYEIYEEVGETIDSKYNFVRNEIIRRATTC